MAFTVAQLEKIRKRILDDPFYLATVLGLRIEWFHRAWFRFCNDNPKHVLEAPRGFGKSTVCTTLLVIWRVLRNFDIRVLLVSRTEGQASRMLQEIRGHLETNEILKSCFGAFVGTGKWTDTALVIAQRRGVFKEATISAMGLEGQITSGHWELEIFDDPFDEESSRTETMRDRAYEWLFTTLKPTLMPGGTMGGRCTRYHYHDLAGRIERELAVEKATGECHVYRLESRDQAHALAIPRDAAWKVLQTPAVLSDGESLWEETYPLEDRPNPDGSISEGLRRKRAEMGERRFGEQYLMVCNEAKEGERGTVFNVSLFAPWDREPDPKRLRLFMRHDPAWTSREEAARRTARDRKPDFTAISVLGLDPATKLWYVLDHYRELLSDREGIERAREIALAWKPRGLRRYRVERTGLQIVQAPAFYRQIREVMPIPVEFVNPQKNKVAHAEPFALAVLNGRVQWNPTIFEKYPDLKENFDLFPSRGTPDDDVDSISGAFLMGERQAARASRFDPARLTGGPYAGRTVRPALDRGAVGSRYAAQVGASRFVRPA